MSNQTKLNPKVLAFKHAELRERQAVLESINMAQRKARAEAQALVKETLRAARYKFSYNGASPAS